MSATWPKVRLGEVLRRVERPEAPTPGTTYRQLGVKLWGEGAYEREPMDGGATRYRTLSQVAADDVVVNKIWARNGSVAVVQPHLAGCFVSGEFPTFVANSEELLPRWMHWLTKTPGFWAQCDEKSQGTSGKNRIKPDQFLNVDIPLPPLAEQQRIVARIERLAALIDEARALRQQALGEADVLALRTAATLFDRIGATVRLGDVCDTASGGTPARERPDLFCGPVPWVKSGELEDTVLRSTEEHISEQALAESSAKLFPKGTLLVALYGATVGRTSVLDIDAATNQAVCAVFPKPGLDRDFVWWFLRRMRPVFVNASFGGAQPNISQRTLRETVMPIAPLSEQRRIVAELDALQARVDALRRLQSETAAELEALLPAILDRAFKGEL